MANEEFYDESRKICEDISRIMGIDGVEFRRKDICTLYFVLLRDTLVHIAAEQALDSDERIKETKLTIPFMGELNLKFENNKVTVESFNMNRMFQKQIKNALTTGESEIDKRLCKSVIRRILENYRDLL